MAGHIDLRSRAACRLWPACSLLLLLNAFTHFATTCSEDVAESNLASRFSHLLKSRMNAGSHVFRSCLPKVTSAILAHTEVSSECWLSCRKVTSTILADTEVSSECWLLCEDTEVCTQMGYHISYSRSRSDLQMRNSQPPGVSVSEPDSQTATRLSAANPNCKLN